MTYHLYWWRLLKILNCAKTFIIISFCLYSCASVAATRKNRPYVYLADGAKYTLLSPEGIEYPIDMFQQISASYNNQDYLFNAWVKADASSVDMILLNELGAHIGELSYRDRTISFSSPVFPKSLKPEYIIADFQLCFYNALLLQRVLKSCGLFFEYSGVYRRVLQGKTVIIEIEKSTGHVRLVNHLRGYAYTLEGDFK
jgi:hypothetical protein